MVLNGHVGAYSEGRGKAAAIALAFVSLVTMSSIRCGGDVTEANVGPKLAAALCGAEASCCANQGAPVTSERKQICEQTAPYVLSHPDGFVFNQEIAAACLKAAAAYQCRNRYMIDDLCGKTFSDPALTVTVPALGPEGAPCMAIDDCAFYDGLSCFFDSPTASTGTCRKLSMTGGGCRYGADCMLGDYCDSDAMTCMPLFPDGTACTVNYCKSGFCNNGVCVPRTDCVLN
jgi:hypothetical protein